ncbi:MAG: hypothetical protein M3114_03970, partial [Thermoproteota archaeon]|nr:hypothetical protein [Thermoproteota archaeon]
MTNKQKREGTRRRKPTKGIAERDSIDNNNSAIADAASTHPKEVFDSSKYNAMSDMTIGSNLETRNVEALADAEQPTNSMKSEHINNETITNRRTTTTTTTTTASESYSPTTAAKEEEVTPKITPMMVEERARTIREVNEEEEEEMHQHLSSS